MVIKDSVITELRGTGVVLDRWREPADLSIAGEQNYSDHGRYTENSSAREQKPEPAYNQNETPTSERPTDRNERQSDRGERGSGLLQGLTKMLAGGSFDINSVMGLLDKGEQGLGAIGKLLPILQPLLSGGGLGGLNNLFGGKNAPAAGEVGRTINLNNYKRVNR
jgi:hypothetical protein